MSQTAQMAQPQTQIFQSLSELTPHYDTFILDLWGLLHNGVTAFPAALDALDRLKEAGIKTCLLSNAPYHRDTVIHKMAQLGITPDRYDHIVTSGQASRDDLASLSHPIYRDLKTAKVLTFNPEICDCVLDGLPNISVTDDIEQADIVFAGGVNEPSGKIDRHKPLLERALSRDLPMICANPDIEVMVGAQKNLCAGAFALWYEQNGGRVRHHGKPHAEVYERCFQHLENVEKHRIMAFGDAFHTDVAGAQNAGIASTLVATGIHEAELAPAEATCFPDATAWQKLLAEHGEQPTGLMRAFRW